MTGSSRFRYSKSNDGKIQKFPKGLRYDKDTGRELRDFDPATADEYFKQQESTNRNIAEAVQTMPAGIWSPFFGDDPNIARAMEGSENVSIWAEKIQIAPDRRILHLACKAGRDGGRLYPAGNCLRCEE